MGGVGSVGPALAVGAPSAGFVATGAFSAADAEQAASRAASVAQAAAARSQPGRLVGVTPP
jgi:hypothetical protein